MRTCRTQEAPDLEARLERLKARLLADEESLFAPAEIALARVEGRASDRSSRSVLVFRCAAGTFLISTMRSAKYALAQAAAIARRANDPLLLAKALKLMGGLLAEMGKPADAVPVLLEALENARSGEDARQISSASLATWASRSFTVLATASPTSVSNKHWMYCPERLHRCSRAVVLLNQGQLLLRVKEIQRGLEAAHSRALVSNESCSPWKQAVSCASMSNCSWLSCALLLAISGKQGSTRDAHAELASGAGEVGTTIGSARIASSSDAHDTATVE